MGEVGKALRRILRERYEVVHGYDLDSPALCEKYDCIHVCFPYGNRFINEVNYYRLTILKDKGLCIIHSTVPVGTSDLCDAVHSPIRGQHPNLERGIRTFTKYFGGKRAQEVCDIFEPSLSSDPVVVKDARTTEALKLWDTAQYAWNILLEKEIHRWCKENNVDFDLVYEHANETYNEGYDNLGNNYGAKKYILQHMPGPIGGHCLIPNAKLLESWITEIILEMNTTYKDEK